MPWGRPERIITGGQVGATTAALVEALAEGEPGRPAPGLVVWDERDVDDRWAGREATFIVRSRPARTWPIEHGHPDLGARLGDLELRWDLRRHRTADAVLVGHVALRAAPWLAGHRGLRLWLPTTDDLAALDAGLVIPPAAQGGPHVIVSQEVRVRRHPVVRDDPRHRWAPELRWHRPPATTAAPVVLAVGAPDRTHGIDLVGRALASRADELRRLGARVRWFAPTGARVPGDEAADLAQAGVADLITIEHHDDPEAGAGSALAQGDTAVMSLARRPGAPRPDDALVEAYRARVDTVAFGEAPPEDLAIGDCWTEVPFGDVAGAAEAWLRALRRPPAERQTGSVGLAALIAQEQTGA